MTREMKDSTIEWVGKIPREWKTVRVSNLFQERKSPNRLGQESNRLSLSYGNIIRKDINSGEGLLPESFNTYNIIEPNDIIIRPTDLQNDKTSLRTGLSTEHGIITSAYIALRPNSEDIDSRCFHYLLHSYDLAKVFYNMGNGVRQGLTFNLFARLLVLEPPLSEQQSIANYLDHKTSQIDALVTNIETQISKLDEYKKALITQAVTKGLDPNAEMKDSGVEWIGEIPKEWIVTKIKYGFVNLDYLREPISAEKREINNQDYPYYGASGIIDYIDHYNVQDTVLLIGEDGANLKLRNLPLIYKASGKFWVNNHAHILKPNELFDYDYSAFLLESGDYTNSITGSAQPKLSQEKLNNFKIVCPPMSEQKKIARYLTEQVGLLDALKNSLISSTSKLAAYKKSLIFDYVTGKKEVPSSWKKGER